MLTKEHVLKIDKLKAYSKVKEMCPRWDYMQGFVFGLDGANPYVPSENTTIMSADIDESTYHVLVIDCIAREKLKTGELSGTPLKDMLTGKDTRPVVIRFTSSDPGDIELFLQKWVDPTFKFN